MAIVVVPKFPIPGKSIKEIEKVLSKFKRKVKDSKILKECYEKSFFEKPSVKKRHKKLLACYRTKTEIKKE